MKVAQIYTGCLAQGTYYIESEGEVAIIDPLREVQQYIDRANKENATIKYIFETHFHADFVSGHLTLSKKTGVPIIFGPTANPSFDAIIAKDEQEFKLGNVTIKVLHTPGHTMESTTYLLKDENGKDHAIFTGDTLFLGDVGRPDLAQKAAYMTQEELAAMMYDSIHTKIMPLANDVIVYPAHGAGSACGKNMMKQTVDTLGNQKKVNYALNPKMSKEDFVKELTEGLLPPPSYFPLNVKMNKEGYKDIDDVVKTGLQPLSPKAFEIAANETRAIVLDVRHQSEFVKGHIPQSIFIGLDGDFAPWVGTLIVDVNQPILLVAPEGREEEAITRLSRVGFDNTLGYLKGNFEAWKASGKEIDTLTSVSASTFKKQLSKEQPPIFDVRKDNEFDLSHLQDANHTPLAYLSEHFASFPEDKTFYVHCAGGYRSVIAASILKRNGFHNIIDIAGGFSAIKKAGIAVTDEISSASTN